MKEISIIIICILLVVIGSNISLGYLNQTSNELINSIDELKEEIKKAQDLQENNSQELANNICKRWEEVQKKWSIIITHNELDQIELALIGMKTNIEENEYEKSIVELEKSVFLLEHIPDKEKLDFKNIF